MESIIARFFAFFKLSRANKFYVKISDFLLRFFLVLVVIFVAVSLFMLGRASKFLEQSPVFSFESPEQEEQYYTQEKNNLFGKISTSTIVASSGGKKYYFVWCKGAANLKENKKRYFDTEESAQKAGYTLASNCK